MAGYSDNRELNIEVKYLRKVLCDVNENIIMPESLRGQALLSKLPNETPTPVRNRFGGWKSSKLFAWQSGVSYAVMFALMVAVFYGVQLASPQIIDGQVKLDIKEATGSSTAMMSDTDVPVDTPDMRVSPFTAGTESGSASAPAASIALTEEEPSQETIYIADAAVNDEIMGVGGVGKSIMLGYFGDYSFAYRNNDSADPDKGGYLSTIDIVDNSADVLAAQIDITDIRDIFSLFVEGDAIVVTGEGPDGIMNRVYSGLSTLTFVEGASVLQPGRFEAARVFGGVLNTLSICGADEEPGCEAVPLNYSTQDNVCVITALRVENGEAMQLAFTGAGDDVSLLDHYAYIYYNGHKPDGIKPERFVAQISLEGTGIALSRIS